MEVLEEEKAEARHRSPKRQASEPQVKNTENPKTISRKRTIIDLDRSKAENTSGSAGNESDQESLAKKSQMTQSHHDEVLL